MYIEHPYFYDGRCFAKVDGKMIEISKEVAYAMNNFYRSSMPKKLIVKNERGEVIGKRLREVPYSDVSGKDYDFSIDRYPDVDCDVEGSALDQAECQEVHQVIERLDAEERMLIHELYFENKTQAEMASIMGISQQVLSYRMKRILNKMRRMF